MLEVYGYRLYTSDDVPQHVSNVVIADIVDSNVAGTPTSLNVLGHGWVSVWHRAGTLF